MLAGYGDEDHTYTYTNLPSVEQLRSIVERLLVIVVGGSGGDGGIGGCVAK